MSAKQARINGIGVLYEEGLTACEIATRFKIQKREVLDLLAEYLNRKYEGNGLES